MSISQKISASSVSLRAILLCVAGLGMEAESLARDRERAAFASDLASDLNCRGLVHLGRAAFVEGVRVMV